MIADDVRNIINTIPRAYMRPMRNGSVLCGSYIGTPEAHAELQSALESAGFNCQTQSGWASRNRRGAYARRYEGAGMTDRFRTDNTDGYDERELAELNTSWARLIADAATCDSPPLLHAYDSGKRGADLLGWFYATGGM